METEKWVKYLNEAKPHQLPKAFDFIKEEIKSEEEYQKILDLALENEVKGGLKSNIIPPSKDGGF